MKYRSKADETRERSGQMKEAEQTRYRDRAGAAQKRKEERKHEGSGKDLE